MDKLLVFYPRVLLISLVVLVHGALLLQWRSAPAYAKQPREMRISYALQESAPTVTPAPHAVTPAIKTPASPQKSPTAQPILPSVVGTPPLLTASSPPTLSMSAISAVTAPADREPDYQASYLNNPKPIYPNVAARMGWQGRVVIRVEVLTTGVAGQVSVQHSSGHEVLDDAALQAVRHWRFSPARHQGLPIAQHFLVPIPFVLKDYDE